MGYPRAKYNKIILLVIIISSIIILTAQSRLSGIKIINTGTTTELSQYGITWIFKNPVTFGTYVNGDYWVIGPVEIVEITPASTDIAGRIKNGSMINPDPTMGNVQGFDSSARDIAYLSELNVARPNGNNLSSSNSLIVPAGSSLISSISYPVEGNRPQITDAAVLTVVSVAPADGAFRPPYCGRDKEAHYNYSQVDTSLLQRLTPVPGTPTMSEAASFFRRPWIDFVQDWPQRDVHAANNMPSYGRDIASRVGVGALMLHLDFSVSEKKELLVGYLQVGIDLWGIIQAGGIGYLPNGGHASGRKWPILFAGLLLGDSEMQNIGPGDGTGVAYFGEDAQTFYVAQSDIDITNSSLWYIDDRHDDPQPYNSSLLGMPEWSIRAATEPQRGDASWGRMYRVCCTATAWSGFVLAARIMGVVDLWDHDALFDYQDRYMALMNGEPDPFGYTVNSQPTEPFEDFRAWTDFEENMWDAYR
ncbi:hypothetical protein [Marispirochaeta aestuarii]|uniref:hypothetical protein n=1 Tax=Marispirochaeta aestuarii TaxID=1963862 RepID=UPI0029C8B8E9|nr:hypothetical protein [Marispirochaeta aestuarii]